MLADTAVRGRAGAGERDARNLVVSVEAAGHGELGAGESDHVAVGLARALRRDRDGPRIDGERPADVDDRVPGRVGRGHPGAGQLGERVAAGGNEFSGRRKGNDGAEDDVVDLDRRAAERPVERDAGRRRRVDVRQRVAVRSVGLIAVDRDQDRRRHDGDQLLDGLLREPSGQRAGQVGARFPDERRGLARPDAPPHQVGAELRVRVLQPARQAVGLADASLGRDQRRRRGCVPAHVDVVPVPADVLGREPHADGLADSHGRRRAGTEANVRRGPADLDLDLRRLVVVVGGGPGIRADAAAVVPQPEPRGQRHRVGSGVEVRVVEHGVDLLPRWLQRRGKRRRDRKVPRPGKPVGYLLRSGALTPVDVDRHLARRGGVDQVDAKDGVAGGLGDGAPGDRGGSQRALRGGVADVDAGARDGDQAPLELLK